MNWNVLSIASTCLHGHGPNGTALDTLRFLQTQRQAQLLPLAVSVQVGSSQTFEHLSLLVHKVGLFAWGPGASARLRGWARVDLIAMRSTAACVHRTWYARADTFEELWHS